VEAAKALSLAQRLQSIRAHHASPPSVTLCDDAMGQDLVHAAVELTGTPGLGFGSGASPTEAVLKAYSEWIERRAFYELAPSLGLRSTNGLAAHPVGELAIENAKLELIERDAFLVSWLARRAPYWLSEQEIADVDPAGSLRQQVELFAANHFALKLGVIGSSQGAIVVVSAMTAQEPLWIAGGAAIQTRASRNITDALLGAVQTQRAAATVVWNRQRQGLSPLKVGPSGLLQPSDLLSFYLNPTNAEVLSWYLNSSADAVAFPDADVAVETFTPTAAWPLTVARASSPTMQDYFACGVPSDRINHQRLRSVFPGIRELNERLHPLS
jgi:ribosomal protein S12 methylthiotransferase accessory factor YcaO